MALSEAYLEGYLEGYLLMRSDEVDRADGVDSKIANSLKLIIGTIYDDGVDEILSVEPSGSSGLRGRFRDGEKVFAFVLKDGKLAFNDVKGVQDRADTVEAWDFDPTWDVRADKARNCTKGKTCGGGCIAASKTCNKTLSANAASAAQKVEKVVRAKGSGSGGGGGSSGKSGSGGGGSTSMEKQNEKRAKQAEAIEYAGINHRAIMRSSGSSTTKAEMIKETYNTLKTEIKRPTGEEKTASQNLIKKMAEDYKTLTGKSLK